MLSPALKELSKYYNITLQIPNQFVTIFSNEHYLTKVISLDDPSPNCEKSVDLSDYEFNYEQISQPQITKTKQELFADALGVNIQSKKPIINLTDKEKKWAKDFLKNKKNILVVGPKSANVERDWPLDNWKQLIKNLHKYNFTIIIADQTLEWKDNQTIFFNHHSLRELFALVANSDFVICQDSGLLHIAGAFDIPSFSIFGPTNPKLRCIYKKSDFIRLNLPCSPCWYERCDTLDCLNLLSVEQVEKEVLEGISNAIT